MRTIWIGENAYKVANHASIGVIRLVKDDRTEYEVELDDVHGLKGGEFDRVSCTCPHFSHRLKGGTVPCKHIIALHEAGLIETISEQDEAVLESALRGGILNPF